MSIDQEDDDPLEGELGIVREGSGEGEDRTMDDGEDEEEGSLEGDHILEEGEWVEVCPVTRSGK